jgi:hypothetical protein
MSNQNAFPWDSLKAETLRSIVNDLGIPVARSLRKREGMVKVLTSVAENGCESVPTNQCLTTTARLFGSENLLMLGVSSRENTQGVPGDCRQGTG